MIAAEPEVQLVRQFNRFYTGRIGLLREGLLGTPFSLTQARVLFEIAQQPGARSSALAKTLGLDPGYLSRLLQSFERRELIARSQSKDDRRVYEVSLTAKGRREFQRLDMLSRKQVREMLSTLDPVCRRRLTASMSSIEQLLGAPAVGEPAVTLRPHRPGDIGWVIARHGEIYAQEYGWDMAFEGLVAEIAGKFLQDFDARRERCWIAELNGERAGCVFLVRDSDTVAKLRLLLVEPWARGHAIGGRLVDECISLARACGYHKLRLWTNSVLHAARRIYQRAGFQLVDEAQHRAFGHDLVGQEWELDLVSSHSVFPRDR